MSRLLLLDLDNTLADREAGFRAWAGDAAAVWAPSDADAAAWLIEEDRDGFRSRTELFTVVKARFGLGEPVEDLVAAFRRGQEWSVTARLMWRGRGTRGSAASG